MKNYDLQTALYEANKERALIYLAMFREIRKRYGEEEAIDTLRTALEARGREFGTTLRKYAPTDFRGLCDAFAYVPDGGKMFAPVELRCDETGLELKMGKCPLKDAWQEAGITGDELKTLLQCASAMDVGTMESAGFALEIHTSHAADEGCCYLKITER